MKEEKIESMSFCDEDPDTDVDSWYVFGTIPKEELERVKELFGDELEKRFNFEVEKYPGLTCQGMLKIVTEKGKYVVPVNENTPQSNWEEHASLVGLWPRLQKEKIERISFCHGVQRVDIDLWSCQDIPRENLDESIRLIDKAIKNADPEHFKWGIAWQGRMKIITDKGKYLVPAETEISNTTSPKVYGNEWTSCELGEYLKKCGWADLNINRNPPVHFSATTGGFSGGLNTTGQTAWQVYGLPSR